jgi:hypothetical protein
MGNHIIHRINLNIEAPDRKSATELQDRALLVLKNDILPSLETYLDSLDMVSESVRFDSLTIDIGNLSPQLFEKGFSTAFLDKFQTLVAEKIKPQKSSTTDEKLPSLHSPQQDVFESMMFFLRTGRLPWWNITEKGLPAKELLQIPFHENPGYASRFIALLINNPVARQRFVFQFSEKLCYTLVRAAVQGEKPSNLTDQKSFRPGIVAGKTPQEKIKALLSSYQKAHKPRQKTPLPPDDEIDSDIHSDKQWDSSTEGIMIENAGLILLHPFLEHFFKEFDLVKEKEFANQESRYLAIHLLHFLATGKKNPMEYELTLEKYLCGIAPEETVPGRVKLSIEQKNECEKLLKAAIGHWKALKKTSPSGFREGFLQRNGKLIFNDFQPRLVVEKKTIDVLLSSLPWSYNTIKLSWLEHILVVDWNY